MANLVKNSNRLILVRVAVATGLDAPDLFEMAGKLPQFRGGFFKVFRRARTRDHDPPPFLVLGIRDGHGNSPLQLKALFSILLHQDLAGQKTQ